MATVLECKDMIRATLESAAPLATMLWGAPGIGKTSLVAQVARETGLGFKSVIAHLFQPVDVLGLPYISSGRCEYAPPSVFPSPERDGERGIFFIDELPNCVPAMQSAWGIIVIERGTRQYSFPSGWRIVCAGNRETDRAGSTRLVSALENRLIHVSVEPSHDEFVTHGVREGFAPAVMSFLEERPDMLLKFDPKSSERAFPSPRSWERASDILRLTLAEPVRAEMLKGAVGTGAAVEFSAFMRATGELPRLQDVLDGSADLSALTRPDVLRAIVHGVLAWAAGHLDSGGIGRAAEVALRLSDEWGVLLCKRLYDLDRAQVLASAAWPALARRFGTFLGVR